MVAHLPAVPAAGSGQPQLSSGTTKLTVKRKRDLTLRSLLSYRLFRQSIRSTTLSIEESMIFCGKWSFILLAQSSGPTYRPTG